MNYVKGYICKNCGDKRKKFTTSKCIACGVSCLQIEPLITVKDKIVKNERKKEIMPKTKVLKLIDNAIQNSEGEVQNLILDVRTEVLKQDLCAGNCAFRQENKKLKEQVRVHREIGIDADNDILRLEKKFDQLLSLAKKTLGVEIINGATLLEKLAEYDALKADVMKICG